jgi:hypothetical protein
MHLNNNDDSGENNIRAQKSTDIRRLKSSEDTTTTTADGQLRITQRIESDLRQCCMRRAGRVRGYEDGGCAWNQGSCVSSRAFSTWQPRGRDGSCLNRPERSKCTQCNT